MWCGPDGGRLASEVVEDDQPTVAACGSRSARSGDPPAEAKERLRRPPARLSAGQRLPARDLGVHRSGLLLAGVPAVRLGHRAGVQRLGRVLAQARVGGPDPPGDGANAIARSSLAMVDAVDSGSTPREVRTLGPGLEPVATGRPWALRASDLVAGDGGATSWPPWKGMEMSMFLRSLRRRGAPAASVVREGVLDGGLPYLAVGQGPPLVVLSAFTAEHANPTGAARRFYLQPLRPLARQFTVYLVNRKPGLQPGSTINDLAGHYADALGRKFSEPVAVVGVSTGGSIAQQFAIDHPQLVRRLVLVASAYRLAPAGRRMQRDLARFTSAGQPRRAWAATGPTLATTTVGG